MNKEFFSKNKRYITSVVYVVVLVLLLLLKWLVADWGALGFDALFCAISIIGCMEFFNAVKIIPFQHKVVSIAFCASVIPLFVLCEMTGIGGYIPAAILFLVYAIALVILSLVLRGENSFNNALLSLCAIVYCGVLSWVFSAVNHLSQNSMPAVLLMFLIVMLTDSFAYVFGKLLKRWVPYRLAPKVSPNKTVIGGVGGLIGGMVAGILAYFIWFGKDIIYMGSMPVLVAFLLMGFVGAIVGQAGDLLESFFKRKCGIKDSGNILPGHGGVLDRFDSMFIVGILVLIGFLILAI